MATPLRWKEMRGPETPLEGMVESFIVHRSDLSEATVRNYRVALNAFTRWSQRELGRAATVGDIEPGTVEAYLKHRRLSVSAETARVGWVALRSIAEYLAELRISGDGESVLRHVRMPRVKENHRRNLTDAEMWKAIECAAEGEQGGRDHAIVITLLGTGVRREELISVRLRDLDPQERLLRVRATTSKSVHPRDIALPVEVVKELDHYIYDVRLGPQDDDAPIFTNRFGRALTGTAIRRLFDRLKLRTGIPDLCAHMLRHTWATNYNRSRTGSTFDLQVEGGWTTARMVDRYCKVRPLDERRRAPSPFTAPRAARIGVEKRPSGMRPSQKESALARKRLTRITA
jgi:site-specific recombinase XerD